MTQNSYETYGYFYRNLYHHVRDADQKNSKKNLIRIDIYLLQVDIISLKDSRLLVSGTKLPRSSENAN